MWAFRPPTFEGVKLFEWPVPWPRFWFWSPAERGPWMYWAATFWLCRLMMFLWLPLTFLFLYWYELWRVCKSFSCVEALVEEEPGPLAPC